MELVLGPGFVLVDKLLITREALLALLSGPTGAMACAPMGPGDRAVYENLVEFFRSVSGEDEGVLVGPHVVLAKLGASVVLIATAARSYLAYYPEEGLGCVNRETPFPHPN